MNRGIWILAVLLVLSMQAFAYEPVYSGCVISTSKGALRDIDCDRTPDVYDNCPLTGNPDQVDRDANGVGDACDLIIDEIRVEPESPMQGRSMVVTVALTNNRAYPMRNLETKLEVPKLGVAANDDIAIIHPGERLKRELIVRIPECAPQRFTDIVVIAEYPFAPGQEEVFSQTLKVPVVSGGTCAAETGGDTTVINILEVQDVDVYDGALYPFTIHNNQPESKAYVLSIDGIEEWGYAEIHPGTVIVIPSGQSRDGALQVWAREGVEGRKSFIFTVQAKDDVKQIQVLANVPERIQPAAQPMRLLFGLLAFFVILVILAAIFYNMKK